MGRIRRARLIGFALPLVLGGCVTTGAATAGSSLTPGSTAETKLGIGNWTTIPVTLVVNGMVVETIAAGGYEDPIGASLPAMPWNVEILSPSGRVLSTLVVHAGDFVTWTFRGGGGAKGDSVRVDLSCGRIDLWYGTPMLGPGHDPNASYSAGDCT